MNLAEFKASLATDGPAENLALALQALWHEANGNWETAHRLAQKQDDLSGAWVHAYLHRLEGDKWNANYWYSRAGRSMPTMTLEQEWDQIADALLKKQTL